MAMVDWKDSKLVVFMQTEPGASVETLKRRIAYGGRKGRAALRRFRKLPHAVVNVGFAIFNRSEPVSAEASIVFDE